MQCRFALSLTLAAFGGAFGWLAASGHFEFSPATVAATSTEERTAPDDSAYYSDWVIRRMFVIVPLMDLVKKHAATFKEFPVRQESGSFTPRQ